MFSRQATRALSVVAACQFTLLLVLAWLRFETVHQRTFDLALYARVAWGLAHGDLWAPVINASALGCHIAPILLPLGLLGVPFGTVPALLIAQSLAIALTVFPLARIGARRLGTRGIWLGAVAWLLYPNLFHVGSYEFHPGTLAVLPMAWGFDALDRAKLEPLVWSAVAVLACREDLGAFCILLSLLYWAKQRDRRALYLAGGVTLYTLAALLVVNSFAPRAGSLSAHFDHWGGSPLGVLTVLLHEPERVFAHFRARAMYLPQVLAPLSFFSLRALPLLLPALPYLLLNMLSAFPTADEQYSHYLTPAVPALIVSGIVGVTEIKKRFLQLLWLATLGIAHVALGGSPLSRDFDRSAFRHDAASDAAEAVLARIPAHASVQAPDALLPHLAERHDVRRAPPPEAGSDFTVLDVAHRLAYGHREVLLRTSEEPLVRAWLARPSQRLIVYAPPYALFAKAAFVSEAVSDRCLQHGDAAPDAIAITGCLASAAAKLARGRLTLTLYARQACPADLALRFGADATPARVELLCDGTLSPSLLRLGDVVRFDYVVSPHESEELHERGLWLGALRASGAPVLPSDSAAVRIPLHEE